MRISFIVGGITLIILGILGFGIYKVMQNPPGQAILSQPINASDHILGNPSTAKISLVEYGDYQCPACGFFHPIVKQLLQEYGDRMVFAYRHFPLPQHRNAAVAAYAAEAAGKQAQYWEMHDMLFEHQKDWETASDPTNIFNGYAEQLGLDLAKFKTDATSGEVRSRIQADTQSGKNSGVDSTPSFFLNGAYIRPQSHEHFKQLIESALNS